MNGRVGAPAASALRRRVLTLSSPTAGQQPVTVAKERRSAMPTYPIPVLVVMASMALRSPAVRATSASILFAATNVPVGLCSVRVWICPPQSSAMRSCWPRLPAHVVPGTRRGANGERSTSRSREPLRASFKMDARVMQRADCKRLASAASRAAYMRSVSDLFRIRQCNVQKRQSRSPREQAIQDSEGAVPITNPT